MRPVEAAIFVTYEYPSNLFNIPNDWWSSGMAEINLPASPRDSQMV